MLSAQDLQTGVDALNARLPRQIRGETVIGMHLVVEGGGEFTLVGTIGGRGAVAIVDGIDAPTEVMAIGLTESDLVEIFAGAEPLWLLDDEV